MSEAAASTVTAKRPCNEDGPTGTEAQKRRHDTKPPRKRGRKWRQGDRFKQHCADIRAYINSRYTKTAAEKSAAKQEFTNASWKAIHGDIVDRSYEERFVAPGTPSNVQNKQGSRQNGLAGEDMYLQLHVNGLCVVGLAPWHPVLRACAGSNDGIKSFKFSHTITVGKGHKKAARVQVGTVLADVELNSGKQIRIRSPVSGKLFGHNSTIISDPSQLYKDPRLHGYVAMVMLNGFEATAIKDNIATAEEYDALAKEFYKAESESQGLENGLSKDTEITAAEEACHSASTE